LAQLRCDEDGGVDGAVDSYEPADHPDGQRPRSRAALTAAVLSVGAVVAVAISDWPLDVWSGFWNAHSMLTNLVSSAVFAGFTVAVIQRWLHRQEQRQVQSRRLAEQRRLTVVRSAAYNAIARGPIAQRRVMWFLVHGGGFRRVPEFALAPEHIRELRSILTRLDLGEASEDDVTAGVAARPDLMARLAVLAGDQGWRRLVHEVLGDAVHQFRILIARWSALLLTTQESLGALQDLAEQAEELSMLFVEFDARRPVSAFVGDQLQERLLLWSHAFANAVSLEEALIDKGGERRSPAGPFVTPGRNLLDPEDRAALEGHAAGPRRCLRLYGSSALSDSTR
jgi:hypothetical protein